MPAPQRFSYQHTHPGLLAAICIFIFHVQMGKPGCSVNPEITWILCSQVKVSTVFKRVYKHLAGGYSISSGEEDPCLSPWPLRHHLHCTAEQLLTGSCRVGVMVRIDLKFVLPTSFSTATKPALLPSSALAEENKSELRAQPTSALPGQKLRALG